MQLYKQEKMDYKKEFFTKIFDYMVAPSAMNNCTSMKDILKSSSATLSVRYAITMGAFSWMF